MPTTQDATDVTQSSVHLDAVRGAAALAVLLGHTHVLFLAAGREKHKASALDGNAAPGGTIADSSTAQATAGTAGAPAPAAGITTGNEAVMVFFVLSGYLVGGSVIKAVRRNSWSWRQYLIKRMTRLWVVLIPAILFGAMLDIVGLHKLAQPGSLYTAPLSQTLVRPDIAARLHPSVLLGNFAFLQEIFVPKVGTNEALWSLANEFWYYIAFPLLLLAFMGQRPAWMRGLCLLGVVAIGFLVTASISERFPFWLLGALLFAVPLRLPPKTARIASIAALILLPVVFVGVRRIEMPNLTAQWIVALYSTGFLYLLLHATQTARLGVYKSVASFFSRISYTLYLVHLPLAVFLSALLLRPWRPWSKSPVHLALFVAMNLLLIGFSYLFYLAFEANTDRVREKLFGRMRHESHVPAKAA